MVVGHASEYVSCFLDKKILLLVDRMSVGKSHLKQVLSFEQMKHLQELGLYHIYTLQDILDKLPCFIGKEVLTIQKLADSYTCLYMEPYTRSIIKITESKELIDAAYDMLCWCIENGYVKVGKEE